MLLIQAPGNSTQKLPTCTSVATRPSTVLSLTRKISHGIEFQRIWSLLETWAQISAQSQSTGIILTLFMQEHKRTWDHLAPQLSSWKSHSLATRIRTSQSWATGKLSRRLPVPITIPHHAGQFMSLASMSAIWIRWVVSNSMRALRDRGVWCSMILLTQQQMDSTSARSTRSTEVKWTLFSEFVMLTDLSIPNLKNFSSRRQNWSTSSISMVTLQIRESEFRCITQCRSKALSSFASSWGNSTANIKSSTQECEERKG